jgi:hypothetical protein
LSRAKPNGFGAGTRARAARATSRPVATATVVRRRTRTPRQDRVQRSVHRAPWSLCAMLVGPTPSHVVRARWPRRAVRAPPLAGRPLHVVAGPCPCRSSPCRTAALTGPSRTAFTCVWLQKPLFTLPARLAPTPSRHCSRQWRPRRAPPSGCLHRQRGLPRPALRHLVASPVTCCSGQTPSSPASELPRPPPGHRRRACTSACSPSQWVLLAPTLGHREAFRATCAYPPANRSPE